MKKLFSFLFTLLILGGIGYAAYTHQDFTKRQINKVRGMYYVYKGDKVYKSGKLNKAIHFYNLGVRYFPGHYGAWYNLGNIYVAYEDYYSALHAYEQAYKHNPKMMIARMNYGIVATQKLGNFDNAIEQYDKIIDTERKTFSIPYIYNNKISTKENKAIAYYNKGVTYRLKSLYENENWELQRRYLAQAIEAYQKSLEISPKRYDTLYNLGLAYHIAGRYMEAGENYCKAIEVAPMNYEAHLNLAILLRRLHHYHDSFEEIDKAATLISAGDDSSVPLQYLAILISDISQSLQHDNEYKVLLDAVNKNKDKQNIKQHKKDKHDDEISEIEKRFADCPSIKYFQEDNDEATD